MFSGTRAGLANLEQFVEKRLKKYGDKRNDPNEKALSDISPWAHFGQVRYLTYTVRHVHQCKRKSPGKIRAQFHEIFCVKCCFKAVPRRSFVGDLRW